MHLPINGPTRSAIDKKFQPISDMRASAAYRSVVLGNLMTRFWLESQGVPGVSLEGLVLEGENT